MKGQDQTALFDLPEADASSPAPRPQRAAKQTRRSRAKQLSLDVKYYRVTSADADCTVQAHSPSAAKYRAFKRAREIGLYCYDGGFLAFVSGGLKVAELRS